MSKEKQTVRLRSKSIKIMVTESTLKKLANQVKDVTIGCFKEDLNVYKVFDNVDGSSDKYKEITLELRTSIAIMMVELFQKDIEVNNIDLHSVDFIPCGTFLVFQFAHHFESTVQPYRLVICKQINSFTRGRKVIPFNLNR